MDTTYCVSLHPKHKILCLDAIKKKVELIYIYYCSENYMLLIVKTKQFGFMPNIFASNQSKSKVFWCAELSSSTL